MAKKMAQKSVGTKGRGRTNITGFSSKEMGPTSSKPNPPVDVKADVNRATSSGGKHRGDRRDMSPTYTTNRKHSARGNTPRKDVTTRAR
ncbi:MAG TPA: hypothetical protein VFE58_03510 [Tepidisphaeraceae bacterium]|jgi:hypothetical protein|nr:hypothetical protein [Tepidisphaeraceae bacterium]